MDNFPSGSGLSITRRGDRCSIAVYLPALPFEPFAFAAWLRDCRLLRVPELTALDGSTLYNCRPVLRVQWGRGLANRRAVLKVLASVRPAGPVLRIGRIQVTSIGPQHSQAWAATPVPNALPWFIHLCDAVGFTYPAVRESIDRLRADLVVAMGQIAAPRAAPPPGGQGADVLALPAPPVAPPEPSRTAGFDRWFEWFHAMKAAKRNVTLREIAERTGYSPGYIRQQHALWRAEHLSPDTNEESS